jgi:hypothetical protein
MGCAAAATFIGGAFADAAASIGGLAASAGIAGTATTGLAGAIGTGLVGAGTGAALGAAEGALTGTGAGKGALGGLITGGLTGGIAPSLVGVDGLSAPAAYGLVGAGAGALGSAVTGGNVLTGGLTGALGGYASGALGDYIGANAAGADASTTNGASYGMPAGTTLSANDLYGVASDPNLANASSVTASGGDTSSADTTNGSTGSSPAAKTGGGITQTALALGALSALGSVFNKPTQAAYGNTPGPAQVAANTGPLFNTGLNTNVPGRSTLNPYSSGLPSASTPGGYGVYGGPEQSYFGGNSLSNFGFKRGGALRREREFRTGSGQHRVRGPGGPEEDLIPARLSDGEYVLDARDVKLIGRGSTERGSKILDRARRPLQHGQGPLARIGDAA